MSKIVSAFKTLTIVSALTKAQLVKASRFVPAATTLLDENKNPIFGIAVGKLGTGKANVNGVQFDDVDASDKLFVTIKDDSIPAGEEARKTYIETEYGMVLYKLNALETQVINELNDIEGAVASVADSIELI